MSLPPARRDISDHPAKGSVTDPVNKDQLNADVDRKLRLYSVIQAFRAGRLPNNGQIDDTLKYVEDHSLADVAKLSPAGQRLVNDIKDIIETARLMVKEKNADELFQNFLWHTQAVDIDAAKRDHKDVAILSPERAKADTEKAAHHLRTLLTLIITNAEARKLFSVVGRDLLARSADLVRPSEEELSRVDKPILTHEPSVQEQKSTAELPLRKEQIRDKSEGPKDGAGAAKEHMKGVGKDAAQAVMNGSVSTGEGSSATAGVGKTSEQVQDTDVGAGKERTKQGFKERVAGLKDRVPQHHREKAHGLFGRAKTFMDDEHFPKERKEQFIYRGKKVIIECQKDSDYQESIKWFLDTLSEYSQKSVHTSESARGEAKEVWKHGELKDATNELLTLLSRFANNTSTQPILDAVQKLYDVAREDQGLRDWFGKVRDWTRRTLLEPGYVLESRCTAEGKEIREEGRKYFDDRYKGQFDSLFDVVGDWFNNFTHDPFNERFGRDWGRLTRDLLFDSEGTLTWKPELWADIRKVIVPQLIDKVGYIPIPRAEYTDENLDLVIENLTLSGRNLFPNIVSLEAHNYARFSPYSSIQDESRHNFTFTLGQMQADMRDVLFYFNKKTGVPKMKDSGIADIRVGGKGITATIHLTNAAKDTSSIFHISSIRVKVDTLKFSIRDSKHDGLYKILRPLATGVVKRQVQRAIKDAIRTALELVDQQLVRVRDRMEEAKEGEDGSRTQALKELFKRQTDEASAKAKEKQEKRQSHFKVVAKRDSLLLPDQSNPQGWVNKQQEKEDIVKQGHDWRSKAFTIVPELTAQT